MVNIQDILQKGESTFIEFKEKIDSFDSLRDEMIAFANQDGGHLVIGISDKADVIGLSDKEISSYEKGIDNIVSNQIKPSLDYAMDKVIENGKKLIVLNIKNTNRPHQNNKGIFYIRKGTSKQIMGIDDLARLFSLSKKIHFDEAISKAKINEELNATSLHMYLDKLDNTPSSQERKDTIKLLNNMNVAQGDYFNLSGLLCFAKNPQKYEPLFYIQCCYFDGDDTSGNDYIDKEDCYGDIDSLYKSSMGFISRNLRKTQSDDNFNSKGILEIDKNAITESIVNALIHREFYISSTIKIFLFKDRLEIISPGGLTNHLNEDKIEKELSIAPNKTLQSIAKHILPYSGLGTGIPRMRKLEPSVQFKNDKELKLFTVIFKREV